MQTVLLLLALWLSTNVALVLGIALTSLRDGRRATSSAANGERGDGNIAPMVGVLG